MQGAYSTSQITGIYGVDDVVSGKHVRDVTPGLYEIVDQNNFAPFVATQTAIGTLRTAKNPEHEWFRKRLFPHWDTIATGSAVGAGVGTTRDIVVTNASYFKVNDFIEVPSATADSTHTAHGVITAQTTVTLTIEPVPATKILAALPTNAKIHNISDVSAEYSTMATPKLVKDEKDSNYVTFLRVAFGTGVFELNVEQFTGMEEPERKREIYKEIKMQFERACIFGEMGSRTATTGNSATTNGKQYFMRGLRRSILEADGDNVYDWSAGMTEQQFNDWLIAGPLKFGSQFRNMYTGDGFLSQMYGWQGIKERIVGDKNIMGMYFTKYRTYNGRIINIHQHHMFEEDYADAALIVDPMYVELLPYRGEKMFSYHENIQARDVAGKANEYRLISVIETGLTENHGWLYR